MIRQSEGTAAADGYNYLFGSSPYNERRFTDMSTHPNVHEPYGTTTSTAAGAYQVMYHTWVQFKAKYPQATFSPQWQDIIACYLISQVNHLQNVIDGYFTESLIGCNKIWASLYLSPYGQPVHKLNDYTQWYEAAGGIINV